MHGGVIQGIGEALQEMGVYDEDGQLLTGTMMDYAVPKASQMPHIETAHTVTPSPSGNRTSMIATSGLSRGA